MTPKHSYSIFYSLFFIFFAHFSIGQSTIVKDSLLNSIKARNIGPAGMSGRVTCIDVDLNNSQRIFIGTASGGVWLSEDAGITFQPIFDDQNIQSIGSIAIHPKNPDLIYVGTGEGNPRNSHSSGNGMYKSIDGGKSWKAIGLEKTKLIHRIKVHPDDPNIVYVGALGSAWGPNEERGLFKSIDGGEHWENILYINDSTGVADLVLDPSNPNKLLVATWEFGRKPWTFNSGGKGAGIHMTHDGGKTWKHLTAKNGLPKGTLGRIGLAIAASNPKHIYALIESSTYGLYESRDGGFNWRLVSDKNIGNRPFYYAELYVDPKNENRIFNLWSYVSLSEDGGKTFKTILNYQKGVHPDHHALWIHPEDPNFIIDGNDGGLNISRDGGKNWRFVTNIPLGQFYHIQVDNQIPYQIYGGMQDNGSWYGPSQVWKNGGIRNSDWSEVYFGDGFDVMPVGDGKRYLYAMSQGGNVAFIDKRDGSNKYIKPTHPENVRLRFHWNAAIAKDHETDKGLFFGSQFVHHSQNYGNSWKIISPDLTTNDSTKQKQAESGGLTIDATDAENHTTILCIEQNPIKPKTIWVGTDDGNLQVTKDGGEHWENVNYKLPGLPKNAWIPQIRCSEVNENELFVVANNYRQNDWNAYAYRSTDNGMTWRRIASPQQIEGHCLSIVQDSKAPTLLFLGTEQGLYVSFNSGNHWEKWTNGFPSVPVRDMQIQKRAGDLVIGTFGRAIWIIDDLSPLQSLANKEIVRGKTPLKLIASQKGYQAAMRSVDGIRFTADAEFKGTNRSKSMIFNVWLDEKKKAEKTPVSLEKKSKKKKKKKSMSKAEEKSPLVNEASEKKTKKEKASKKPKMYIFNAEMDTVFQKEIVLKKGLNRLRWNMRKQVNPGPSWKKRDLKKKSARIEVAPGKYELLIVKGELRDSAKIEVLADPRVPGKTHFTQNSSEQIELLGLISDRLGDGTDLLYDYKQKINLVNKTLVNFPDTVQDDWLATGDDLKGTMDSLIQIVLAPRNKKGIDAVTYYMSSRIWKSLSYIYGAMPGDNENLSNNLNQLSNEANDWLEEVNGFTEGKWTQYIADYKALQIDLFDELKIIENVDNK